MGIRLQNGGSSADEHVRKDGNIRYSKKTGGQLDKQEEFGLKSVLQGTPHTYPYAYLTTGKLTPRLFPNPESRHGAGRCDLLHATRQ